VRPIENISGHSIDLYNIHAGKSVMFVKNDDQTKMEEGEYFAIETFGSTGSGRVLEAVRHHFGPKESRARNLCGCQSECSHYAKIKDAPKVPLRYVIFRTV
jgi:methionyl aminopeptidase